MSRQHDLYFQNAFEDAPVGMVHVGEDDTILQVNRRFMRLLGYDADELIGRSIQEIIHPGDRDLELVAATLIAAGGSARYRVQKRFIRKDGREIWGDFSVSAGYAPQGEAYLICVLEDDSQRKMEMDALRDALAEKDRDPCAYNL